MRSYRQQVLSGNDSAGGMMAKARLPRGRKILEAT